MMPLTAIHPNGVTMRYCLACAVAWAVTESMQCWVCGTTGTLRSLSSWRCPGTWRAE